MRPRPRYLVLLFAAVLTLRWLTGCSTVHGQTYVHGGSDHPTNVGTSVTVPWGK